MYYVDVNYLRLRCVRVAQVGGEAFRPSLLSLVTGSRSLRNVYGPTETTIWSSSYNFDGKLPTGAGAGGIVVPIGKPISQVSRSPFTRL